MMLCRTFLGILPANLTQKGWCIDEAGVTSLQSRRYSDRKHCLNVNRVNSISKIAETDTEEYFQHKKKKISLLK